MAEQLKTVFLSTSVPDPRRDPRYHATGDVVAIREAIRALVGEILPRARLVFGGHPAISSMIDVAAERLGVGSDRVRIYQSEFFRAKVPQSSLKFADVRWTPEVAGDGEASLSRMREAMIGGEVDGEPVCAVFIGGMEGVEEEYRIFRRRWPRRPVFPIASTGAAARILLDTYVQDVVVLAPAAVAGRLVERLRGDLAYDLLIRDAVRPLL